MGNFVTAQLTCPKCKVSTFDLNNETLEDAFDHITKCYQLKCPNCPSYNDGFSTGYELLEHVKEEHTGSDNINLTCPKCQQNDITTEEDLINHYIECHNVVGDYSDNTVCPICASSDFQDKEHLLDHLDQIHSAVIPSSETHNVNEELSNKLPKVGDRIIAMWGQSKWQYFHAKIKR